MLKLEMYIKMLRLTTHIHKKKTVFKLIISFTNYFIEEVKIELE